MRVIRLNNGTGLHGSGFERRFPPFLSRGITRSYAIVTFSPLDWLLGRKTIRKHLVNGSLWRAGSREYRLCPRMFGRLAD